MRLSPLRAFSLIVALVVFAVLVSVPSPHQISHNDRAIVTATVFPIYDIVKNVAGDLVDVRLILPPGASPHTFEPGPSALADISASDALFTAGHGLDGWAASMAASAGVTTYSLDAGIALHTKDGGHDGDAREDEEHRDDVEGHDDDDHHHSADGTDPHYWLAMSNGKIMAQNAAKRLTTLFPEHADGLQENLEIYEAALDAAMVDVRAILSGVEHRSLVTMHDAWYYFAEENNLDIVATVTASPGQQLTPRQLTGLTAIVKDAEVRTIYSEPQLSTSALLPFVTDLGLGIAILDPLGGTDDHASYLQLMRDNARVIAENQR